MPPMGPPNRNRNQKKQKPKNTKATAKRLFSYLEQEKHKIAAAFVCVLVSSASTLCGSYLAVMCGIGMSAYVLMLFLTNAISVKEVRKILKG